MHRPAAPSAALLVFAFLLGLTSSLPILSTKGRSLIDLSPNISPDLDLSSDGSCFGLGISACDPITVVHTSSNGKKYANSTKSSQDEGSSTGSSSSHPNSTTTMTTITNTTAAGHSPLININVNLSPKTDVGGDNTCTGVGVSVCDPISVSDGTSNSTKESNDAEDTSGNSSNDSSSTDEGSDNSGSGSLINININISPEVDLGGDNVCIGLGISACDSINVNKAEEESEGS